MRTFIPLLTLSLSKGEDRTTQLELAVQADAKHRNRAAVGIVGGIGDELIIRRRRVTPVDQLGA